MTQHDFNRVNNIFREIRQCVELMPLERCLDKQSRKLFSQPLCKKVKPIKINNYLNTIKRQKWMK